MTLSLFHPVTRHWFSKQFPAPTDAQNAAWPAIKRNEPALIAAPTGSGKTLAAFMCAIDDLLRSGLVAPLQDQVSVLYVSPLKALSNDIQKNLQQPLNGIRDALLEHGLPDVEIRALVRTGDTPQSERQQMRKHPPHILVTTPESLYILLTSDSGRQMLSTVKNVIVDEIHALANNKRGAHLSLSLERLNALCTQPPNRIGLSATQKPITRVAEFLVGQHPKQCQIIDSGHSRERDLALELTGSPLQAVMPNEVWEEVYDRLTQLIESHKTTLVFVNTRRLAERAARHLADRIGEEFVTAHHGSLSREHRLQAEQKLKSGQLKALVATASLELGIDIGDVNLVCQLGSSGAIATFLQRVGRSGHAVGATPKGRLFPLTCDELVECTALLDAVNQQQLDDIEFYQQPLDVLAQQIVAEISSREWSEHDLLECLNKATVYKNLDMPTFKSVLNMLADGFTTRRGRRGAYLHYDRVNGKLRARRGARLTAVTNGGAIPDQFDYDVILQPEGMSIGTLNEDFAFESLPGDIFQLGNTSYRMLKIEQGRVFVEDAKGEPPNIPFWFGEAPGRSNELSQAVSSLRETLSRQLDIGLEPATRWVTEQWQLPTDTAQQLVDYLASAKAALGTLPTQHTIIFERFFDETGDMHLVIHSSYGSRINRAWGLALRKRFCRKFNFELQAAALEDSIVLSLGATHSFPLEEVAAYLKSQNVREILIQALLDAPMFPTHWRWNANIALAVPRFRNGKKVPAYFQRNDAEDLISLVFPDQLACLENITGNREIPDHPLVQQTITDCITDIMDIDGLEQLLKNIESKKVTILTRDLNGPSPLSQAILNARPYAFLDDAPAEERRTMAVQQRRFATPMEASELSILDQAAIDHVKSEAWPIVRNSDELHDALVCLGFITEAELQSMLNLDKHAHIDKLQQHGMIQALTDENRIARMDIPSHPVWVATERLFEIRLVFPDVEYQPRVSCIEASADKSLNRETALVELVRSRLEGLGPVTAPRLAMDMGIDVLEINNALLALENEGFVIQGYFSTQISDKQWCERRLLARIHRYTIKSLRNEIEPVSIQKLMQFLFHWQHLDDPVESKDALLSIINMLEGYSIPAAAWEKEIFPARMSLYIPDWLDSLCSAGRVSWKRIVPANNNDANTAKKTRPGPISITPIALINRQNNQHWSCTGSTGSTDIQVLPINTQKIYNFLKNNGASFFDDLVNQCGMLRTQLESTLGELVALGLVSSDSFIGLRALITPHNRKPGFGARRRLNSSALNIEDAGRWTVLSVTSSHSNANDTKPGIDHIARTLLKRYGVVFRKLLDGESNIPRWRDLLYAYRRMEARGEIRGGRFVAGFSGEQFALPEAVASLRNISKMDGKEFVCISAVDPLNLSGFILSGKRIASSAKTRLLFHHGKLIAVMKNRDCEFIGSVTDDLQWRARNELMRKNDPTQYVTNNTDSLNLPT